MSSSRFEIRRATAPDSQAILRLIHETPQEGRVTMNFEREPDFFHGTAAVTSDCEVWVAKDLQAQRMACVYSVGRRPVYVNGEKQHVIYGNDLRLHPNYRNSTLLARVYKEYKKTLPPDGWVQTVILADNLQSLATIGSGRAGLPIYYPFGDYITSLVYLGGKKPKIETGLTIRRAREEDLTVMQAFFDGEAKQKQLYPCYDFSQIETNNPYYRGIELEDFFLAFSGDELVGITGIWDQKPFKQTRFVAYDRRTKVLRHLWNAHSKVRGGMVLPPAGGILDYFSLHTIVCQQNNPTIFAALLRHIYRAYRGTIYKSFVCGLAANDPLLAALNPYRRREIVSKHFLFSYEGDPRPQFDERQLYLEVSRL